MKYKFPEFQVEIENPTITIVRKSNPNLDFKLLNIEIKLETVDSRIAKVLEGIYCEDAKTADFNALVLTALEEFKVEEQQNEEEIEM